MTIGLVQAEFDTVLARYSLATKKNGPLTKIMCLDPKTGAVVKDGSECWMAEGTLQANSITSLKEFADSLRRLGNNQALVHGISDYDLADVTTKDKLAQARAGRPVDARPVIARSLEDLQYPEGPGLLMFDHDKARGNSVAENDAALRSYRPAELVGLIAGIIPEIASAGRVSTPSTSSCIFDKNGKELRGEGSGSHIYFPVENGRDIPRFLEVLGKRLFLAGYGRVEISRSGSLLFRTLIDLLIGSPERLDFAAGAVCEDGLVQKLPAPTVQEGTRLNTALLLDLTPDEELAYKDTIDRLTELARPSQEIVKEQYVEQEASKLSTDRKISIDDARRVVLSRQDHVLTDDDLLCFAHMKGDAVSVADALNDPSIYDNKPLADPLEPEYDGGSLTKARFFWNDGNPIINSFAHGQSKYTFKRYAAESTTAYSEEDISGLLERSKIDCGAPFGVESIKMLSWLKSNDKSRFMQVRTEIKKINQDVGLSELDKDIHLFSLKRTSIKCSQYSSSSLSSTYPSSKYSQNEKVLHFRDVLIKKTVDGQGNEKQSLVVESVAADLISGELRGHFAFDITGVRCLKFTGSRWKPCSQTDFDTAVTELLYVGAGVFGFRNAYQTGVAALLQKGGQNRLGEATSGTLPFLNGLLNISDKTLQPITPDNAFSWVLPFDYTESAKCPNFLKWLSAAVDGDQETVRLLQAWLNALLTGRPDLQVFLHLIGPGGTGKSTFGRIVFILVGNDNATTTSLRQLETNRFEAANIYGKRLVAIEEADKYGGSVSVLKSMTGQDPLRLERKNQQQSGSFIYGGQTIMMSNERLSTG